MNANKLKAQMALHGENASVLAEALGITAPRFSQKINERGAEFNKREIMLIKERYNLTPEELDAIFFDELVS